MTLHRLPSVEAPGAASAAPGDRLVREARRNPMSSVACAVVGGASLLGSKERRGDPAGNRRGILEGMGLCPPVRPTATAPGCADGRGAFAARTQIGRAHV